MRERVPDCRAAELFLDPAKGDLPSELAADLAIEASIALAVLISSL